MKPIKFHPVAETEMVESAKYYESQQNDLGKRFLESVQSSINHIRINPDIYQIIHENIRRCQTKIFPFGIIFREQKNQIEIITVMHLKREPGYWKERM